jgi:C-terminal processing protease CtpA/Prc
MKTLFALAAVLALAAAAAAPSSLTARQQGEDFDTLWRSIDGAYAYFDRNRPAWRKARVTWRPRALKAESRAEFVAAIEGALGELRDDHVSLSERTPRSPRRVPAETDIWAAWKNGAAVIEGVRTFGDADVAGVRPGHVVTRIQGVPVDKVVRDWLAGGDGSQASRDWALRHALAGPRQGAFRIEVSEGREAKSLAIERLAITPPATGAPPLIARRMGEDRDLGYIRIKAGLADARVVEAFDGALNYLKDTRALIVDLREVSGPGSHGVTRALLGRFVSAPSPWQLREAPGKAPVTDTVPPRGETYRAPLVVLVDRWTADEGEALAAGLNAAAAARLVGTEMAGMRGEPREVTLPHSGIVMRFPAEKVLHVDGTPRERLRPSVEVDLAAPQGGPGDPILYQALKILEKK